MSTIVWTYYSETVPFLLGYIISRSTGANDLSHNRITIPCFNETIIVIKTIDFRYFSLREKLKLQNIPH